MKKNAWSAGHHTIEFTLLKQCGCVKPWGGWRDFQIQLSLRTHRLSDLKSEWRVAIIIPPPPLPLSVTVAVDANFIRWSFNSHVTALECNLLGSIVSRQIEIDRSLVHDREYGGSLIVSISDRTKRRIKPLLVWLLPIALPSLGLIRTWCTYSISILPPPSLLRLSNFNGLLKKFDNPPSHCRIAYWLFLYTFIDVSYRWCVKFTTLIVSRYLSALPFFFLIIFLLTVVLCTRGYTLSQLFSAKLSRSLRVAICFDRGSHP